MYAVRLTQRLLRRGHLAPTDGHVPATTALGDWFVRDFNLGRHRLLVATSSTSLLTVIVPARDLSRLPTRLAGAVHELLFALGAPLDFINQEIGEMQQSEFARTNNRSVLGTINDMAWLAEGYLEGFAIPDHLLVAELKMAGAPCSPLRYRRPVDAAIELLGLRWSRAVRDGAEHHE